MAGSVLVTYFPTSPSVGFSLMPIIIIATTIGGLGSIGGTFLGGILHTLPFLIPQYRSAMLVALAAIAFELLALAWIRRRFFGTAFLSSFVSVTLGGAIIATISAALGTVR